MRQTATQAPRTMTRQDIMALARTAGPWEFLPLGIRALGVAPEDHALRALVGAHYAKVGLRTPAREVLAGLPPEVRGLPEVGPLCRAVEALPDDRVPGVRRRAVCERNLRALGQAAGVLRGAYAAWAASADGTEVCLASDGNILWRTGPGPWQGLGDEQAAARRAAQSLAGPVLEGPLFIEGLRPPWLLREVLRLRRPRADGYAPRTYVLQRDAREALDGMSLADLSADLRACAVEVHAGEGAAASLRGALRERVGYEVGGPVVSLLAAGARCEPAPAAVVREVESDQSDLARELGGRVGARYANRDPAWWRGRYADAARGGAALRVLIPTCLYSTFLRHSSRDLAAAFERAGCAPRVLIEPDASTRLASPAYLRALEEFDPDLVVFINYPRSALGGVFPAQVPYCCWVQDAMPHLFDPRAGAAQGPLDYLYGYLPEELFAAHGYPRARAREGCLAADEVKFHPGPVDPALRRRLECEVAYVSHQSEPPDRQHARLADLFGRHWGLRRSIGALSEVVEREAARGVGEHPFTPLREHVAQELRRELGREPEPRLCDAVHNAYCLARIDRLLRHRTLEWAAEAARRRGWRLRLYGKGWESHPTLGEFAAGELAHGEELRASYACAGVHLHVAGQSLVHQRIIECVLAGGAPMCRLHAWERWAIQAWHVAAAKAAGARLDRGPATAALPKGTIAADARALPGLRPAMDALGLHAAEGPGSTPQRVVLDASTDWSIAPGRLEMRHWSAYWVLGERPELFFHDGASLEQAITRLLEDPGRRSAASQAARTRALEAYTYRATADRIIRMVRESLGPD